MTTIHGKGVVGGSLTLAVFVTVLGCGGSNSRVTAGSGGRFGSGGVSGSGVAGNGVAGSSGGGAAGLAGSAGGTGVGGTGVLTTGGAGGGIDGGGGTAGGGAAGGAAGAGAATGAGAGGAAGAAAGGKGGGVEAIPNVEGRWALIGFEDPVAVELVNRGGGVLGGLGCVAGFDQPLTIFPCRPIEGTLVGRRARFRFPVDNHIPYVADVHVSARGDRMAGTFLNSIPTAWLRLGPSEIWLSDTLPNGELRRALPGRLGVYELSLNDAASSAPGSEFVAGRTYEVAWHLYGMMPMVDGDLGAFWGTEMSWRQADQTLVVGPVSVTAPNLPISLSLRFQQTTLKEVEAITPSGARYVFTVTKRLPL